MMTTPIRFRITLSLIVGCLVWVDCSDATDGTIAPAGDNRIDVTPRSVTTTALGETIAVTVTVGGRPVSASMSLRAEQRWLDDRGVVDAAALTNSQLVTRAPGHAVLNISAASQTDSVIVNVRPTQVTVLDARLPGGRTQVGDGDTIVLRGYRLNELTAANLNAAGATVSLVGADSANARVVVPTLAVTGCGGAAPTFTIAFNGVQGSAITGLSQRRSGEFQLAVGEARRLTDAEAACIRLPRTGSARYLAAYVDTRLVVKAQTGPEYPFPERVLVSAADRSSASSSSALSVAELAEANARVARRLPAIPHDVLERRQQRDVEMQGEAAPAIYNVPTLCPFADARLPFCRKSPYVMGEEFLFYPGGTERAAAQARVVAIRGNLVAALFLPDSALLPPNATLLVDSALDRMQRRAVPLLQRVFDLVAPTRTSDESAQLFIALEQISGAAAFAAWFPDPYNGHGRWGRVALAIGSRLPVGDSTSTANRVLALTAHEVTHTYQFRWRFEHASPWLGIVGGWAVEGGANFFGVEMQREDLGIGFLTDFPRFYQLPVGGPADLWSFGAPSFMRDLVQRLVVDGGTPYEDAVREVMVGALEGWYGINEEGLKRGLGLTARMQQRLGASWNPIDGLLDWIMSQAADELTSNPHYQNRTSQKPPNSQYALYEPITTLTNGAALSFLTQPGSTGVIRIDDARGGSYSLTATLRGPATDALEWLILRVN